MLSFHQLRPSHLVLKEAPSVGTTSSGSQLLSSWPGGCCLRTEQRSGFLIKPNLVPRLENIEASTHESSSKGLG